MWSQKRHTCFDTQDIMNGKEFESALYNHAWLERNALGSTTSLETSATFFETRANTDAHSYVPSVSGSCQDQEVDQFNAEVMALSLDQRECRSPATLMIPHNDKYLEGRNMRDKAHKKKMQHMLATLCGDNAEAQLVRANTRFLNDYITAVTKRQTHRRSLGRAFWNVKANASSNSYTRGGAAT